LLIGAALLRQLLEVEVEFRLPGNLLRTCGSQVLNVPGVVQDVVAVYVFNVDVLKQAVYQSVQQSGIV
jgi:hypothetical protein